MIDFKCCEICGKAYAELHHIVFKSESKALEDSEYNFKYLCEYHHRNSKEGIHFNKKFNLREKIKVQEEIIRRLDKEELTKEQIKEKLELSEKNSNRIVKNILPNIKGLYKKDDVVRSCMGGKIYFKK